MASLVIFISTKQNLPASWPRRSPACSGWPAVVPSPLLCLSFPVLFLLPVNLYPSRPFLRLCSSSCFSPYLSNQPRPQHVLSSVFGILLHCSPQGDMYQAWCLVNPTDPCAHLHRHNLPTLCSCIFCSALFAKVVVLTHQIALPSYKWVSRATLCH